MKKGEESITKINSNAIKMRLQKNIQKRLALEKHEYLIY